MFKIDKRYLFALFVIIVALNWPSLNGPFILDDNHTIQTNAHIKNISTLSKIWTSGRHYSALPATWGYRPVTTASNILMWQVADGETWPFHALKWILFFFICFLSLKIWRQLLPNVPDRVLKVGLLLFAINPVHSQLLGYISATSSLLATLFILTSLFSFLIYRQNRSSLSLWISMLSALLATLAKEEGVVIIALLIAVESYLNRRENKAFSIGIYKKTIGPILFAVAGVSLIFWHFETTQNIVRSGISPWEYFMTQWRAYIRYLSMFFWSYDLNADNLSFGFAKTITEPRVLLALAINLAIVAFALFKLKTQPLYLMVCVWFYASVAPSSSIVPLGEPVNDHRALTAYVGLGLLVVLFLSKIYERKKALFWFIAVVVGVAYANKTYQRSHDWADKVRIWSDTVEKNPTSGRALNNLATALLAEGEYEKALEATEKCLVIASYYPNCYINKGIILASLGREKDIEASFAKGMELDLHYVISRQFWARYLLGRGFLTKAYQLLIEADRFTAGNNLEVRIELIKTLRQMGKHDEATKLKNEAIDRFGKLDSLKNL